MAKQEQHDIREYYIMAASVDPNGSGRKAVLPIPFSAQVIRMAATAETVVSLATTIRLRRDGVNLQRNGVAAGMLLANTDVTGQSHVVEYSPIDPQNYLLEGVDGDRIENLATLELFSTGETAAAAYTFVITLRA